MPRVAAAVLVWLAVLVYPADAGAAWKRLSSAHFTFVGDASERDMRTIADRLERFRAVVGRAFGEGASSPPAPTVVVVFQNDKSFAPFRPVFQGKPVAVAGYFVGAEDVHYIAVNAQQEAAANAVVFHESGP